jgi:hypothetical protein
MDVESYPREMSADCSLLYSRLPITLLLIANNHKDFFQNYCGFLAKSRLFTVTLPFHNTTLLQELINDNSKQIRQSTILHTIYLTIFLSVNADVHLSNVKVIISIIVIHY